MLDLNIRILRALSLISVLLLTIPIKSPAQGIFHIRNFSELENIIISYNYPDFHHPVLSFYADSTCTVLVENFDISELTRFSVLNKDLTPDEDDLAVVDPDNYHKKIIESLSQSHYIISLSMLYDDQSFVYGVFKNDLLLWKESEDGYELIAIYPECIAGCLFCGAHFINEYSDTLTVRFSGRGLGEEWGGYEKFIIEDDALVFLQSTRFRNFTPYNDKGNPTSDASSFTLKEIHYSRDGQIIDNKFYFDARHANNKPILLPSRTDSLQLYQLTQDFPETDLTYIKTIKTTNLLLRVGPVHGNYIPVFWEGRWFITYRNNLSFPDSS